MHPMFDSPPPDAQNVPMPDGCALVEHSIFCGKDSGITIVVRTANAPRLLPPADNGKLTRDQEIVLVATSTYKASYGGVSNFRFREATRQTGITESAWNSAKTSLIDSKHLNKRGAITPKGRNAADSSDVRMY
jgi:hypothetical protein